MVKNKSIIDDVKKLYDYTNVFANNTAIVLNNNKYLAGLAMILFNIGSRYLIIDMSKNTENILKTKIFRRLSLFSIFFVGTRDIFASFVLTAVFLIFTMNLFNEESKYCILPHQFKDNIFTEEEYEFSKKIINQYEEKHNIKGNDAFCNK